MLQKTIDKEKRKERKTWVGYHTRLTPTKKEKIRKLEKRHKQKSYKDFDSSSSSYFILFS